MNYKPLYLAMQKDVNLVKKVIYEAAQVMILLTENNIVHSDVKPENILIKTGLNSKNETIIKEVKLIDYGSCF